MTSLIVVPEPGPFEPDPCVTRGGARDRSAAVPSAVIVIIIVAAWLVLVVHGVSPEAATAGLGAAAGLGLKVAARLAKLRGRGRG
jgi:hypothetical protein